MRRRTLWLAAGIALLLLAYLLERSPEPAPPRLAVEIPRAQQDWEAERAEARRRPAPLPAAPPDLVEDPSAEAPLAPPPRDPILSAFGAAEGELAVVFEVNALVHAPILERLFDCLPLEEFDFLNDIGFDMLQDLDRIALLGDSIAVSGLLAPLREARQEQFEAAGSLGWSAAHPTGDMHFGLWNDELLLASPTREGVEAAIDRLEGRLPSEEAFPSERSYGEIYGRVPPALFAEAFESEPLLAPLIGAIQEVELHANVRDHAGLVLDVRGDERMGDLLQVGRALLSVARSDALGVDEELGLLMEQAQLLPAGPDGLSFELAVPDDLILRALDEVCADLSAVRAEVE